MIIKTDSDRAKFIDKLMKINLDKLWLVEARQYAPKRSAQINRLYHLWLSEIAKKTHYPVDEVTNYCKFTYGCPILIRDSAEFEAFYGNLVSNLDYEQAVASMEYIAITRLFKTQQMVEYMHGVETYALKNEVILTDPDFRLYI